MYYDSVYWNGVGIARHDVAASVTVGEIQTCSRLPEPPLATTAHTVVYMYMYTCMNEKMMCVAHCKRTCSEASLHVLLQCATHIIS